MMWPPGIRHPRGSSRPVHVSEGVRACGAWADDYHALHLTFRHGWSTIQERGGGGVINTVFPGMRD